MYIIYIYIWNNLNFAICVTPGQINTLNKLLKNDRMPTLRNLCILPLMVSQERDEEMEVCTLYMMYKSTVKDYSFLKRKWLNYR